MAAASYNALNDNSYQTPYGSTDPRHHESTGYIAPAPLQRKKGLSKWIKFGIPLLIAVIIAAVVAGVVATRKHNSNASTSSSGSASAGSPAAASSAVSAKLAIGRFATATDSEFMVPVYPSTVSLTALLCCRDMLTL